MPGELWKDPFPPEMFPPGDDQVRSIIDKARRPASSPRPRFRLDRRAVGGLSALILLIVVAAFASRGLNLWMGDTVLPRDANSGTAGIAGAGQTQVADEAAPADGALSPQIAGSAEGGAFGGEWVRERVACADAVVLGAIENGTLRVSEVLLGSTDALVAMNMDVSGDAIVLLERNGATFQPLRKGFCVLLLSDGSAYDADGKLIEVGEPLTEQAIREVCAEGR